MTRKSKARYNLNRTYKVSQTVKALRRALALGLATAAVAPAAQAGFCINTNNDVQCFGDFGDTTLRSGTFNDLEVADTFDPATVEMNGTIYTDNYIGIDVWNNADLSFANDGEVFVNDTYSSWSKTGVYAESFQGDVTFDNTGVIAVVRDDNGWNANAVGARVEAAHDITITNSGFVAAENNEGFAGGIQAISYNDGIISISNALIGDIGAESNDYGNAVALGVYGGGTVTVSNDGDIGAASRFDSATGIRVQDGDTTITASSTSEINVQAGNQAFGIDVFNGGYDAVDISNAGLIETDGVDDAYGIRVHSYGYGDVTVSNSGIIDSYANNDYAGGIFVSANTGDVSISNTSYGTILAYGNQDSAGIGVNSNSGAITVTNAGSIESTSSYADGIRIYGADNNTVNVTNSGGIDVKGGTYGTGGDATGININGDGLTVNVTNSGGIYAFGGDNYNAGIYIDTLNNGPTSYGSVVVTNTGAIAAGKYSAQNTGNSSSYGDAYGVQVYSNGNITVTNTGDADQYGTISALNENGGRTFGVQASSDNGDISVTNSNKYSIITAASGENSISGPGNSTTIGIYAEAFDGSVNVNNGGLLFSVNNNYGNAIGIRAEANEADALIILAAYAADGDITVANTGYVVALAEFGDAYGVQAFSNYGDIAISNTGTGAKYSSGGTVIRALAQAGDGVGIGAITGADGDITITNNGAYVIAEGFDFGVGVAAITYGGDITITNSESAGGYGGMIAASAFNANAIGISTSSKYGNTLVNNSAYVIAESAYGSAYGMDSITGYSSDGTITVNNTGIVVANGYGTSAGIKATSDTGAITISNYAVGEGYSGIIIASASHAGYAYGINAEIRDGSSYSDITITNGYGAMIGASAKYANEVADAYGIAAQNAGYGDILITNAGTVNAVSYDDAQAIWTYAGGSGNISITNTSTGKLYAESAADDAYGVYAWAEGDGNITVSNAGDIHASTSGDYGYAYGVKAYAYGNGNISVTNTQYGSIIASATGYSSPAYGIYGYADGNGNVTVSNAGSILAEASGNSGDAFGIAAGTNNEGDINVTNTGSITAGTSGNAADAHGIFAYSDDGSDITISNGQYGSITVNTSGNYAFAVGIEVINDDADNYGSSVSITNNGTVTVGSTGSSSNANGIWTHGGGNNHQADVSVVNNGSFNVTTTGSNSDAWGIEVEEILGDATVSVTNNGDVTVAASYGDAFGIQTGTYGFETYTDITNNGDLTVSTGGNSLAIGIGAYADYAGYGDIRVTNTASGYVDVSSAYGTAVGIGAFVNMNTNLNDGGDVIVNNAGDVQVQAYSTAHGILVDVAEGSTYVPQQGYNCGYYYGCYGLNGYVGYNGFVITQYSSTTPGQGGMDVFVTNSGSIDVTSDYSFAEGIAVRMAEGDYLASVNNTGDITVSGDENAWGISVQNSNYGNILVDAGSASTIDVSANKYAHGIQASAELGDITVYSEGSITSAASKYAGGIDASTNGESWIRNTGAIDATADNAGNTYYGNSDAQGIRSWGFESSYVSNTGDITVSANSDGGNWSQSANASGISSASDFNTGWSGVYSDGDISVTATSQYGTAYAEGIFSDGNTAWITTGTGSSLITSATGEDGARTTGLWANANDGNANVYNEGLLSVTANSTGYGDATATGVRANADLGDVWITNEGVITASASTVNDNFAARAYGMHADTNNGNITINNKATGTLTVTGEDYAAGIYAYADYGDISVTNAAAVTVNATGDTGDAYGIYAETGGGNSTVTNSAAITVTAGDYAAGIYAYANGGDASVTNTITGHVRATGDSATGISVQSNSYGYDATLNNAGKITVVGNDGNAYGAYVETDGYGTLSITSSGDITVTSAGFDTYAVGLYAQHEGYGSVSINSGSKITVNNNSDYGDAVGIKARSYDGSAMSITNSGTILANANNGSGFSAGIYTENFGGYSTTISNSGSVKATGNNAYAVYHYGTDVDITNTSTGKIFGVIATDYGNDTFTNNGKWYATEGDNYVSSFQEGDDSIVNSSSGKIYMEDSTIDMGSASAYGSNSFLNTGKVYVNGYYNVVNMGTATSVFTNNGTSLHFEDGAADDHLTIIGDFAGNGHIVVDAEGTSMLADRLYIQGDVVTNTANVIDVYLDQNPSLDDVLAGELIDIVAVSGTSLAANFNLGIVDVDTDSLYTLDYELVKQINYSGTNDLFSLGFEVSGLTPSGVAVSSIAPTVQNLWHLGVGTVFQREGTMRDNKGGGSTNSLMNAGFKNATGGSAQVADYQGAAGLWLRAFTEDGGLNPDGNRGNFGTGGAHGFDMKNSGIEFGAGYAFNSQWTAGLLGGVSDGSLKPTIGGRTSIDAKTIGGYVTYTPGNGFYADLSYRSMDFDGNGNGGGQDFSFDGKADGYSLETGYGFKTSSGLVVEPQFQYSSMDVNLNNVDYNQGGFNLTDGKSSQTRLGVSLRKTMDSGNGNSWTPYASLSYVNESNASNDYIIGGVLTGNVDTSGNSTLFEGGATVKYGNMLFSGGLNWKDGGAYESVFGGQVSVRFTW